MITSVVKRVPSSGILTGVVLCTFALTFAVCPSGPASASTPSTTAGPYPSSTTTQPSTASVTATVINDYRTMWANLVSAARTSNYQSKLLPQHATGDALSLLVQGLAKDRELGIVTKGQPVLQPSVSSLTPAANPTKASITDFSTTPIGSNTRRTARYKRTPPEAAVQPRQNSYVWAAPGR
jgi:hypothetical protein